jgi:ribosomal protein L11 methylase PrmA
MISREPSSFRDPSAFMYFENGIYYRFLHYSYKLDYDHLLSSGLYESLTQKKWLIEHEECENNSDGAYKLLKPRQLRFLNYPYEWSFRQLKDAALLTLGILKESIKHGMILKDATAFNIVFEGNKPVFIDSASFERYDETKPWKAYRQFCECFLAPLVLARYRGSAMLGMQLQYPEGIPIALTSKLLPGRSWFHSLCLLHIHLQNAISGSSKTVLNSFSKEKMMRIISHLESGIKSLDNNRETSQWSKYYTQTILSPEYLNDKISSVSRLTRDLHVKKIVDLGANTGEFAALFTQPGAQVIAADFDHICIDQIHTSSDRITSVVVNLMNPTPAIGWMNCERKTFEERINADLVLALALMHHLCISKNLSFDLLASGLSKFGEYLLVEYVPIDDPKAVILLAHRDNIFQEYTEINFREAFAAEFELLSESEIADSKRKLFLMKRKIKG